MEVLSSQYDKTLNDYNSLNKEYIEFLNSSASQDNFITLNDHVYTGTNLSVHPEIKVATMCSATCSKTSGCTGATFNSKACILQSGDGNIKTLLGSKAIIQKKKYYLIRLDNLNNILQGLIQQMQDYQKTNQENIASDMLTQRYAMNDLTDQLVSLNNEKNEYAKQIEEVSYLDPFIQSSEQSLMQNLSWFQVFAFIAVAIIAFVAFSSFFSRSSTAGTSTSTVSAAPSQIPALNMQSLKPTS